ncbi:MAG: hypothetical protein IPM35_36025 [Myxococcales bacterium]|nr:hypothetical protein [Myxococcales bacterium]
MTLAKKGARKIVVAGVAYRWHVSRWRRVSDWTPARAGLVDEGWLDRAEKLGLGRVADVTFTIAVERYDRPASKLLTTYHALVVDGFLGPEQLTRIQPRLVGRIVAHAVESGWDPGGSRDFRMEIVENSGKPHRPALLVVPGVVQDDPGYERRVVPIRISE